jgi:hypothetical protein
VVRGVLSVLDDTLLVGAAVEDLLMVCSTVADGFGLVNLDDGLEMGNF